MSDQNQQIELTVEIVSAYVAKNPVTAEQLPPLIQSIYASVGALDGLELPAVEATPDPAVSIKKSLRDDHLVCLDCGKKFKSIKRHLGTSHDLTPEDYRQRWGLKSDYPMVAPAYAATRSEIAQKIGLGRKD